MPFKERVVLYAMLEKVAVGYAFERVLETMFVDFDGMYIQCVVLTSSEETNTCRHMFAIFNITLESEQIIKERATRAYMRSNLRD